MISKKAKTTRGYLVKRGEFFQNWKKRFFVLENGVLSYRPDDKPATPVIKSAKVLSVITWNGRDNGLCIKLDSGRDLYVDAQSEEKRDAWYDAVESHVRLNEMEKLREQATRRNSQTDDSSEDEDSVNEVTL
ncbi:TPA: hypothetical protein N0F65_001041 [Lagenidium giganteum]|uniref:PH domain-containing protein n=1 Tax=Lagenidium giganteum TaxID=4803 RepID=A0AAV2YPY4_9STRA|nr:TPA: hypothetical protein N0F65_001041 [Lagenidium giganteum]